MYGDLSMHKDDINVLKFIQIYYSSPIIIDIQKICMQDLGIISLVFIIHVQFSFTMRFKVPYIYASL